MLLGAGAKVSNLGDVKWEATEDGSAGKGTGRHIAQFVLDGKNINCDINGKSEQQSSDNMVLDALLENEAERSELLIAFMKWYKNTVPIGTQKSSVEIVKEMIY